MEGFPVVSWRTTESLQLVSPHGPQSHLPTLSPIPTPTYTRFPDSHHTILFQDSQSPSEFWFHDLITAFPLTARPEGPGPAKMATHLWFPLLSRGFPSP